MVSFKRIAIFAIVLAAVSCKTETPIIPVEGGLVSGVESNAKKVTVFKGIPYAAAPVGDLRWTVPAAVTPWDGVKVCDTFGPAPMQEDLSEMDFYGKEFYSDGMPEMSEDCLYLNIWAPSESLSDSEAKLPVAFWIHGGAFTHGYGNEIEFDGDAWATRGVILVTINYREGLFGFMSTSQMTDQSGLPGYPANFAMYDQIAALKWVKNNISLFGGDPDNITIFGQSAGAMSVKMLVSSSLSNTLMAKAIIQSGGGIYPEEQPSILSVKQASAIGDAFAAFAGYETLEEMKAAPAEEIMAKYEEFKASGHSLPLRPVLNEMDYPLVFSSAAGLDKIADIPYMIGYVDGDSESAPDQIDQFCSSRLYYEGKPVFQYRFRRELPGDDAGAFHSAELWYMFGTLDRSWRPFTAADEKLSREMLDAWTNFCKYGDPCGAEVSGYWPRFSYENPYRKIFDIEK